MSAVGEVSSRRGHRPPRGGLGRAVTDAPERDAEEGSQDPGRSRRCEHRVVRDGRRSGSVARTRSCRSSAPRRSRRGGDESRRVEGDDLVAQRDPPAEEGADDLERRPDTDGIGGQVACASTTPGSHSHCRAEATQVREGPRAWGEPRDEGGGVVRHVRGGLSFELRRGPAAR